MWSKSNCKYTFPIPKIRQSDHCKIWGVIITYHDNYDRAKFLVIPWLDLKENYSTLFRQIHLRIQSQMKASVRWVPGCRLTIKAQSCQYWNSHYKDKMVSRCLIFITGISTHGIGRTVPLLKPPQSPHCYLGEVDHAKKFPPTPGHTVEPGLIALIGPLRPYCSQSPLILLRCVTEIKFAQNLRWLGNWH